MTPPHYPTKVKTAGSSPSVQDVQSRGARMKKSFVTRRYESSRDYFHFDIFRGAGKIYSWRGFSRLHRTSESPCRRDAYRSFESLLAG